MNPPGGRKTLQEYRTCDSTSEYRIDFFDEAYRCVARSTKSEIIIQSMTARTDYRRAQESHQRTNENHSQQQPSPEVIMDEPCGFGDRKRLLQKCVEAKAKAKDSGYKKVDDCEKKFKNVTNHNIEYTEDEPKENHLYSNETSQQKPSEDAIQNGFLSSDGSRIPTKDDIKEFWCDKYDIRTMNEEPSNILNEDNEFELKSNGPLNIHCSSASMRNRQSVPDVGERKELSNPIKSYSVYSTTEDKSLIPKYCASFDASVTTQCDGLAKDGNEGSLSENLIRRIMPDCYDTKEYKNILSGKRGVERKDLEFTQYDRNDMQLEQYAIDDIRQKFVTDLSITNNDENDTVHQMTQQCHIFDRSKKFPDKNIGKSEFIYHTASGFESPLTDGPENMAQISVYEMVQFFENLSRGERSKLVRDKVFGISEAVGNWKGNLTSNKDIDSKILHRPSSDSSSIPNNQKVSRFTMCSQTSKGMSNESRSIDECSRMDSKVSPIRKSYLLDLDDGMSSKCNVLGGFGNENLHPDSCRNELKSGEAKHQEDDSEMSQVSRDMMTNDDICQKHKKQLRTSDNKSIGGPSTENNKSPPEMVLAEIIISKEDADKSINVSGEMENATDNKVLYIAFVVLTFCRMSSGKKRVESASLTEVAASSDEAACFNFSVGNPHKREFYSPNYPNHYPKNTKCTLRITADVGHMVMLDFRDLFRLENSGTCEYDRLEVRDGAYGYSPLIGQFCGADFPSKMYSSKRYMWLQFSSDDSIEYEGFRAVYDYVPIPNQGQNGPDNEKECSYYRSGSSGIIEKSEIGHLWHKYRQDDTIECMWTIEAEAGKKLYINFNKYKLDRPNDCDQNFIQLFHEARTPDREMAKFCGTTAEPQKSDNNVTHVRLFTHKDAFNNTDFTIHYTAFREIKKDAQCDLQTEFNCGDQTCIDILLKCDGEFDCKYRYDEEPTLCARALGAGMVLTSEHMIIILVVFFSLVVAMCASISISCYNKIKERRLREREYKERRSKEASVEATLSASVPPPARQRLAERMADDESSDGGCYVPEVDLSVFNDGKQQQRPNGGNTIPKKTRGLQQQQQQHYPYISESFESLASDVIVPPAPPPVPAHLRGPRRDPSPPPPTYRIVGGKVVANPAKNEPALANLDASRTSTLDRTPGFSRPGTARTEPIDDPKSSWLRGPLEAGAPARTALGPSKYGMSSRVTPDAGARGPLAALKDRTGPSAFGPRVPYVGTPVGDASDSSRAHSVASTLSAPDALLGKR